ncbi:hypothetical protein D3C81_700660 [compost metagenome]
MPRFGSLRENIKDQLGSVDDFDVQHFLQVADLGSGQFLIENRCISASLLDDFAKLKHLSLSDEPPRVGFIAILYDGFSNLDPSCLGQLHQFGQRIFGVDAALLRFRCHQAHQYGYVRTMGGGLVHLQPRHHHYSLKGYQKNGGTSRCLFRVALSASNLEFSRDLRFFAHLSRLLGVKLQVLGTEGHQL